MPKKIQERKHWFEVRTSIIIWWQAIILASIGELQYCLFFGFFFLITGQVSYPKNKNKNLNLFDPPVINFIVKGIIPARLSIYLMLVLLIIVKDA
jgi:hypothetical protein